MGLRYVDIAGKEPVIRSHTGL
ncbi:MAG: hypothetical protein JWQ14_26, partial [Adhaeribacter sp.]|nr:hypothetical protein [Adhaeribacter sp.]